MEAERRIAVFMLVVDAGCVEEQILNMESAARPWQ